MFTYLAATYIQQKNDISIRKAKTWAALNKPEKIWKLDLNKKLNRNFFKAVVQSVLCDSTTWRWTLTKKQEQRLDGCYVPESKSSSQNPLKRSPNQQPQPSYTMTFRQSRSSSRSRDYVSPDKDTALEAKENWLAISFSGSHPIENAQSGAPVKTFTKQLQEGTGYQLAELPAVQR